MPTGKVLGRVGDDEFYIAPDDAPDQQVYVKEDVEGADGLVVGAQADYEEPISHYPMRTHKINSWKHPEE